MAKGTQTTTSDEVETASSELEAAQQTFNEELAKFNEDKALFEAEKKQFEADKEGLQKMLAELEAANAEKVNVSETLIPDTDKVFAKRGNETTTFSKFEWEALGNDKGGWKQDIQIPNEISKIKIDGNGAEN